MKITRQCRGCGAGLTISGDMIDCVCNKYEVVQKSKALLLILQDQSSSTHYESYLEACLEVN